MTCDGEIVARFLVYVDDIVISGPVIWVNAVMEMIRGLWPVKVTGLIVQEDIALDLVLEHKTVKKLNFLGMTIEHMRDKMLAVHQHQYLVTKLRNKNMLMGQGRDSLPVPVEGRLTLRSKTQDLTKGRRRPSEKLEPYCGLPSRAGRIFV